MLARPLHSATSDRSSLTKTDLVSNRISFPTHRMETPTVWQLEESGTRSASPDRTGESSGFRHHPSAKPGSCTTTRKPACTHGSSCLTSSSSLLLQKIAVNMHARSPTRNRTIFTVERCEISVRRIFSAQIKTSSPLFPHTLTHPHTHSFLSLSHHHVWSRHQGCRLCRRNLPRCLRHSLLLLRHCQLSQRKEKTQTNKRESASTPSLLPCTCETKRNRIAIVVPIWYHRICAVRK